MHRLAWLTTASQQSQADDFSWDDEEEAQSEKPAPKEEPAPSKPVASTATSPRDSEESYDVVSDDKATTKVAHDDEDSDWE
jgi:hypothetical protein